MQCQLLIQTVLLGKARLKKSNARFFCAQTPSAPTVVRLVQTSSSHAKSLGEHTRSITPCDAIDPALFNSIQDATLATTKLSKIASTCKPPDASDASSSSLSVDRGRTQPPRGAFVEVGLRPPPPRLTAARPESQTPCGKQLILLIATRSSRAPPPNLLRSTGGLRSRRLQIRLARPSSESARLAKCRQYCILSLAPASASGRKTTARREKKSTVR